MSDKKESPTNYSTRIPDEESEDIEWWRERKGLNKSEAIRALVQDGLKHQTTSPFMDRLEAAVKKAFRRSTISISLMVIVWMQMELMESSGHEWAFDQATVLAIVGTSLALYGIVPTLGMFKVIWDEYANFGFGGETT